MIDTIKFIIAIHYFTIANLVFKQKVGIPMGIDLAPYWEKPFTYAQQLISKKSSRDYEFNGTSRFKRDLCTINDNDEFSSWYKFVYLKQLELKIKHFGGNATFLDLKITIGNNVFVYQLFDQRDQFPSFHACMSYLSINIPSSIFYGSIFSVLLQKDWFTLRLTDFVPTPVNYILEW